jgi:hypothetical protein
MTAKGIRNISMNRPKVATLFVFGLSILFVILFDFCKHDPVLGAANPFAEDPFDAVGSFGVQLALFSAFLTMVRVFRPYSRSGVPPAQLLLIVHGGTVVLLSVTVTLTADTIGLVRSLVSGGGSPAAGTLAGLLGGMALVTLTAGWIFVPAARSAVIPSMGAPWRRAVIISGLAILILIFYPLPWRNSGVPGAIFTALTGMAILFLTVWTAVTAIFPITENKYEDVFDDMFAIFQALSRDFGRMPRLFNWMRKLITIPQVRRLLGWLNPRRHLWNLVVLAAVALGLLLVLVEAAVEGLSTNLGRVLVVIGVYVGLESAGVLLGTQLFRKYLGLFKSDEN